MRVKQISRKLGVFDRKLQGSHNTFYCYRKTPNREDAKNSGGKKEGLQSATGNTSKCQVDRLLVLGE